jgi:acyl-CoA thioester hydrolase
VYYANYLNFLERARSEWLRALGFEQDVLQAESGVAFVVRRVEIDYRAPARFNDQLSVTVIPGRHGPASIDIEQTVECGARCLVQARVKLACVEAVRFKPVKMPLSLLHALDSIT